jgi:phosphatidylinositol 3-kinase
MGLKGQIQAPKTTELLQDPFLRKIYSLPHREHLYITCQPFADGKPLCLPIKTAYQYLAGDLATWNEWIVFPIPYSQLPISTQIAITVWDCYSPRKPIPVGGSTMRLFGKHNTIRRAKHRLKLWSHTVADPYDPTKTPSKTNDLPELNRLEKLMRRYHRGDISKVDWLDKRIEQEIEKLEHDLFANVNGLYLYINLPIFDFPLVFNEPEYTYPEEIHLRELDHNMVTVFDAELFQENPVENKHRKLARSHRTGPLDRELKPTAKLRDEINDILRYPPTKQLVDHEKDLLWKFRFYLTRDKKALTKFLKCVIWKDPVESKQAVELLQLWISIDVEDALELLSPEFKDRNVREFAVQQLKRADNSELLLYLLQLVQAIKFERMDKKITSPLVEFLIKRGLEDEILGNYLHWYLMVECEDTIYGRMFAKVAYQFLAILVETPDGINRRDNLRRQGELIATLSKLSRDIRSSKEARPRKVFL